MSRSATRTFEKAEKAGRAGVAAARCLPRVGASKSTSRADVTSPRSLCTRADRARAARLVGQRERVLDLLDACSRHGRRELPRTSRPRTGLEGSPTASRSTSSASCPRRCSKSAPHLFGARAVCAGESASSLGEGSRRRAIPAIFRYIYTEAIDELGRPPPNWRHLRDGNRPAWYGQRDPKNAYKRKAQPFLNMMAKVSSTVLASCRSKSNAKTDRGVGGRGRSSTPRRARASGGSATL